jgi:hypothetical protein
MNDIPQILSLGAGVQSSTLALMAAAGEVTPMPTAAIFADTQDEPQGVYDWLDWLEKQVPFPVHRVTAGRLSSEALRLHKSRDGRTISRTVVPMFTLAADGEIGRVGHRTCTADFKLKPILKAARKLASIRRGQKHVGVIQWIGISRDESLRMKPSKEPWAECRWPLIELRMTRQDCLEWMAAKGFPVPPRSACVFCPFHSLAEWRRLQTEEPAEFQRAVDFEKQLQSVKSQTDNMRDVPYLHRSCKPLDQIDFRSDIERGQTLIDWQDECTGMCGN